MVDPQYVTQLPKPAPSEVVLRADEMEIGFTPRELRMIRESSGRSWSQIMADDDSDEKFAILGWLKLRRDGHQLAYSDMDDVVIRMTGEPPDPTSVAPSTSSPPSAATGA
jgi:hypothetical protein